MNKVCGYICLQQDLNIDWVSQNKPYLFGIIKIWKYSLVVNTLQIIRIFTSLFYSLARFAFYLRSLKNYCELCIHNISFIYI